MSFEPNTEERQRGAFQLLRDKARSAHREGDGLFVGHLCEIALQEIDRLIRENALLLSLRELRWIFIFEYYWLLHTQSIQSTVEIGRKIPHREPADAHIAQLLECYAFLIRQPLVGHEAAFEKLDALSFEAFGSEATPEIIEITVHLIELAWFNSAPNDRWANLLDRWQKGGPVWMKELLPPVKKRLAAQTQLTAPDKTHPPLQEKSADELRTIAPLAELWLLQLCGRWKRVIERIQALSPRLRSDAYDWRLFADFWHTGIFISERQTRNEDSQGVWLARRRALTTDYPLLIFQDQRELRIDGKLRELFRLRKQATGSRWEIMTLAMLHELAALRLWDFGMWREAVVAQSETLLEAAQWENPNDGLTEYGLELAIRGGVAQSSQKDFLTRDAIRVLEFSGNDVRDHLATAVFNTYPWQKHATADLLTDVADLLPPESWLELAKWTVSYANEMRDRRTAGWRFNPLEHWDDLLPSVPSDSEIWQVLLPEIIPIATVSHAWHGDTRHLLLNWFVWAPLSLADDVAEKMKLIDCPATDSFKRAELLCEAECDRGEVGRWTRSLYASANNVSERFLLSQHLEGPEAERIEEEFRAHITSLIRDALTKAVPPPGAQQFQMGPFPVSTYLVKKWRKEDLKLLNEITVAINSLNMLRDWMWFLITTAQLMVSNGPPEFGTFIRPFVQQWIYKPPIGRSTTEEEHGAFATVHISSNARAAALQALGWLVFQLPRKLGASADNDLLAWISQVTSSNELSLMPLAFHSCVVLAAKSSAEQRGSILAAAKSILLTLRIAARDRVEAIHELARAVNYLGKDLSAEKGELIDWSSSAGRDALQEFLDMLNGFLPALCSSPEATVRAQVAFLLWNLKKWHPLDEKLDEGLKKLLQDTRASVRFAANGGWHLARKRDQFEEPQDALPAST